MQPYDAAEARHQVIIIVYEDWMVQCFDSSLQLLWEKEVGHHSLELDVLIKYYKIHDVSVYIAPLQIKDDASSGIIVVGASMSRRTDSVGQLIVDDVAIVVNSNDAINSTDIRIDAVNPDKEHPAMHAQAKLEHFNVYALDAVDGHVLWKYDGLDVRPEQFSKSLPQHAYSLDLKDLMTKTHHAPGINDWTVFRQSLVDELPHGWFGPHHTRMRIAHFVRRHIGAGTAGMSLHKTAANSGGAANNGKKNIPRRGSSAAASAAKRRKGQHKETSSGKGRNGRPATLLHSLPLLRGEVETEPLSSTATLPHNAAEHTENPNVIVAHTQRGLEVIALRTGVPITSLALPPGRCYADIDGDGVVDTISILDLHL